MTHMKPINTMMVLARLDAISLSSRCAIPLEFMVAGMKLQYRNKWG